MVEQVSNMMYILNYKKKIINNIGKNPCEYIML